MNTRARFSDTLKRPTVALAITALALATTLAGMGRSAAAAPAGQGTHGPTRTGSAKGVDANGVNGVAQVQAGGDGYTCTNCYYHPLYLHLPAELQAAAQLQWKQNGGTYIPLRFRLEYCRTPGSDCDTINGNLRTDGTVEITTSPGQLPYTSCPTIGAPFVKKVSVSNWTWSAGCIGQNGTSEDPCIIDTDWSIQVLTRAFYPDGTKCLWRIGLNQHSDADAKFTQHDLGYCGTGDYAMTLNTPWTWLYGETAYCFRYQFQ